MFLTESALPKKRGCNIAELYVLMSEGSKIMGRKGCEM